MSSECRVQPSVVDLPTARDNTRNHDGRDGRDERHDREEKAEDKSDSQQHHHCSRRYQLVQRVRCRPRGFTKETAREREDLLAMPMFLPSFTSHSLLDSFAAGEATAMATPDAFGCSPDEFGSLMISSLVFWRVYVGTRSLLATRTML